MKLTKEQFRRLSQTDLAKVLNLSQKTIWNWVEDGMPYIETGGDKKYDVREVMDWKIKNTTSVLKLQIDELKKLANQGGTAASKPQDDDFDEDAEPLFEDNLDRQRYYQAKLVKTKYMQLDGTLIAKDFHEEKMMEAGDFVRSALQSIPKELSIKLAKLRDAAEVEKLLDQVICDKLKEMAQIAEEKPE